MLKQLLLITGISLFFICFLAGPVTAQQSEEVKLDPKIYDAFLGSYRLPSGDIISVGRTERRLYYFHPLTGSIRGLKPESETIWSAGPSLLVYSPQEFQLRFVRDKKGVVGSLVLQRLGFRPQTATQTEAYFEERVNFRNADVTLAGTLLRPNGKGPHPAVVFLHGSGPQDRNGYASLIRLTADYFARHGFATLIYDKRGVGASTGE